MKGRLGLQQCMACCACCPAAAHAWPTPTVRRLAVRMNARTPQSLSRTSASPRQRQPAVVVCRLGRRLGQRTIHSQRFGRRFHARQQLQQSVGELLLPQRLPASTHLRGGDKGIEG